MDAAKQQKVQNSVDQIEALDRALGGRLNFAQVKPIAEAFDTAVKAALHLYLEKIEEKKLNEAFAISAAEAVFVALQLTLFRLRKTATKEMFLDVMSKAWDSDVELHGEKD